MKFTKKQLEAIPPPTKRQTLFDEGTAGLAVKVSPSGHRSFYFFYRSGRGRQAPKKSVCLGPFPTVTVEQARDKARKLAAQVVNGEDPAEERKKAKKNAAVETATVETVWKEFFASYSIKPRTRTLYDCIARLHFLPDLGKIPIDAVTGQDVEDLYNGMKKSVMANRTLATLSVFFNWCEQEREGKKPAYRAPNTNPTKNFKGKSNKKKLFVEKQITDFLSADQLADIGLAVSALEQINKISQLQAAALRVLLLTGMRLMEVLSLRWEYLDLEKGLADLPDSKTGAKVVPLSAPAVDVLRNLPHYSDYVFFSTSKIGHLISLKKPWALVQAKAGLKKHWRIHDLRHGFASAMVNKGASLELIAEILGHKSPATTKKYSHVAWDAAQAAANKAAELIAASWNMPPEAPQAAQVPAPVETPPETETRL